jgi:hypothetical protein
VRTLLFSALLLACCKTEAVPTATFQCGRETCRAGQYCSLVSPQVPPNMIPVTHSSCVKLPDACEKDATCDCLAKSGVPGTCRDLEGGLRVAYRKPAGG